ncbi:MAG: nuclear transport factor 2 family protein [bacterium]|jgi:ketosteroid isomerase-like protein
MSYLNEVQKMYDMLRQGQMMDAFEKFYHEEVIMEEATGEIRKGKAANREFQLNWLASVETIHGGGTHSVTSNEETGHTAVESWMDITFKDGNRMKMEEVAIQKWEGDKIVRERFYYNIPGQ